MVDIVSFTKVDGAGDIVTYTVTNATAAWIMFLLPEQPGSPVE